MGLSPVMSLLVWYLLRGIGPIGRFLTAGQAGARRRPAVRTFDPCRWIPLRRV